MFTSRSYSFSERGDERRCEGYVSFRPCVVVALCAMRIRLMSDTVRNTAERADIGAESPQMRSTMQDAALTSSHIPKTTERLEYPVYDWWSSGWRKRGQIKCANSGL